MCLVLWHFCIAGKYVLFQGSGLIFTFYLCWYCSWLTRWRPCLGLCGAGLCTIVPALLAFCPHFFLVRHVKRSVSCFRDHWNHHRWIEHKIVVFVFFSAWNCDHFESHGHLRCTPPLSLIQVWVEIWGLLKADRCIGNNRQHYMEMYFSIVILI